jgi:hypothetical protein
MSTDNHTQRVNNMIEFECSFRAPLTMLFFQYWLQIAAPIAIRNNNGTKSTQDWTGCEGRDEEEAKKIWHGGCFGWTAQMVRRI